jgi:hypothetical protein
MEMRFGEYIVKKESKKFFAIYKDYTITNCFITHRSNWSNACRVAKLLNQAYREGRDDERGCW